MDALPSQSARLDRQSSIDELCRAEWHNAPLTVVLFGASGDLAKKLTFPALFALYKSIGFPSDTVVIGYARSKMSSEDLRLKIRPFLLEKHSSEAVVIDEFLKLIVYSQGSYDSSKDLKRALKSRSTVGKENRLFYLALPPSVFVDACTSIKKGGLRNKDQGWHRIVVEKPFGVDTQSAAALQSSLAKLFPETVYYRIDHYLAKEMVANLLVLRFGNAFLEPIWNRSYISAVVVTFKENFGVSGRGGYFDDAGIIRDVVQNHLIQVLALLAMEPPSRIHGDGYAEFVRDEKVKVLKSIKPFNLENTVLGQFSDYTQESDVPSDSTTPTFVCLKFEINNPRWDGVPFFIKAGKALNETKTEIRVQLKKPPGSSHMFGRDTEVPNNELVIRLQPNEAIYMKTNVKKPGLHSVPIASELDLTYKTRYPIVELAPAYTRLILDVLRGKQATFVRSDEVDAAWRIVTPLLKKIEQEKFKPVVYENGSRGPAEADEMIKKAGYIVDSSYGAEWASSRGNKI